MDTCMNAADNMMYYNITLLVLQCTCLKTGAEEHFEREKYFSPLKHVNKPEYERSLLSSLKSYFDTGDSNAIETNASPVQMRERFIEQEFHCQPIRNYEFRYVPSDYPNLSAILLVLFCVMITTALVILLVCVRRKLASKEKQGKNDKIDQKEDLDEQDYKSIEILPSTSEIGKLTETIESRLTSNTTKETPKPTIKLVYQQRICDRPKVKQDLNGFLKATVDKLCSKLDRSLVSTPLPGSSLAATATPRLARRALHSRQRIGSSPSLQPYDTESSAANGMGCIRRNSEWKKFKHFCYKTNWKEPFNQEIDDANLYPNSQQLLRYFQRVCPISSDIWSCSTMITNYALLLLETELKEIATSKGYRFIEMVPSGSATQGTKVGKPNQFDVLMILQPPIMPCGVVHADKDGRLPPGHILINVHTDKMARLLKQGTICQVELQDTETPYFLSSSEFHSAAEEMIHASLQNLYTNNRIEVDRLPFKISRSSSANLSMTLDTKNVVGLGLSDIKIALHPVFYLPTDGWLQDVPIYATPPPLKDDDVQGTNKRKSEIPRDFLWLLNFTEVHMSYMKSLDLKLKHAGIDSCHMILLMILKSLFTGCNRNNLLDRGELCTAHISHVISFLMLESSPQQWTFDHLSDRFSDVVHFLQDAFRNERLPSFFLNNPHLIKDVPFVANNALFKSSRQFNILTEVPNKEKCLEYMEKCLRESGLKGCVKPDYSSDMWEYEFFVY